MAPLEAPATEGDGHMGGPDLVIEPVPALTGVSGCLTAELAVVGEPLGRVVAYREPPNDIGICQVLAQAARLVGCGCCHETEKRLKPAWEVADLPAALRSDCQLEAPALRAVHLESLLGGARGKGWIHVLLEEIAEVDELTPCNLPAKAFRNVEAVWEGAAPAVAVVMASASVVVVAFLGSF